MLAFAQAPAQDKDNKHLLIRWHGQSFFEVVSTKGTRIVLDPHAIEAYGRKLVLADIVLISHFHDDHTQTSVVENVKKAKVIAGLKEERIGDVRRVEWNNVDEKINDVRIRSLGTYHDAVNGMQRGLNSAFIIDVDGLRIVHLGDLGHTLTNAQVRKIGEVDILMIPVGGVYTLNGLDAAKVVEQLKPKRYILPMHYGTSVYDYLVKPDYFLNEFDREQIKKYRPGENELQVDPKAPVPEKPIIPMLHYFSKLKD
jgi:L-ascorbate metabolism protein UlaG (beta-lactamase superfamily)